MHTIGFYEPAKNRHSRPTSFHRARYIRITAFMSATGASFTTPVSRVDGAADRWKMFLSSISLEAAAFGFDAKRRGSIAARQWRGRVRAWANPAIGS